VSGSHATAAPGQAGDALLGAPAEGAQQGVDKPLDPSEHSASRAYESASGRFESAAGRTSVAAGGATVAGRLEARDRPAADRQLAGLLTAVGGVEEGRRVDAEATVVDVVVPRAAYARFTSGLARIGPWRPGAEPRELPERVRVRVRIAGGPSPAPSPADGDAPDRPTPSPRKSAPASP